MDYKTLIEKCTYQYTLDIYKFLRDMIKIASTSTHEKKLIERIQVEMEKLEYEEIIIDGMGNILGRMGSGKTVIALDGHIDTVDVGEL